jgi:hypothetical protein
MGSNRNTIIALLIIALVIAVVSYNILTNCDCECWAKTKVINYDFHGTVIKKYVKPNSHGTVAVLLDNNEEIDLTFYDIFDTIQTNDYIIKQRGSLKHWLIRNNDTILFYPTCKSWGQGFHEVKDEKRVKYNTKK